MLVMERFKELSWSSGKTVTVDRLGRGGGAGTTGAISVVAVGRDGLRSH